MYGFGQSHSVYAASNIITGFQPFILQIATNIRNRSTLGIHLELLQGGVVVARITHEHAELTQLE
ncbi:hypothetical protein WMW72_25430 [Paenibacillus filicis]|uniref:Uncharacterized protein n=1 Tax=Paenibacillus filicis TaxID=669464 RepID=A0ABU9DT48_9BACL